MYVVKVFFFIICSSFCIFAFPIGLNGDLYCVVVTEFIYYGNILIIWKYFFYSPNPMYCVFFLIILHCDCIRLDFVHMWCNTEHSKPGLVLIVIVKLLLIIMEFHLTVLACALFEIRKTVFALKVTIIPK